MDIRDLVDIFTILLCAYVGLAAVIGFATGAGSAVIEEGDGDISHCQPAFKHDDPPQRLLRARHLAALGLLRLHVAEGGRRDDRAMGG